MDLYISDSKGDYQKVIIEFMDGGEEIFVSWDRFISYPPALLLEFDWNDDFLAYVAEWENFRKSIYLEGSTFITLSAIDHLSIYKMIPNNIFSEKEKERIIQETNRAVTFEMDKGNFTIITIKIQTPYYGNNLKLAKEGREKISKDWEYLNFLATNFENYVNKLIDDRR